MTLISECVSPLNCVKVLHLVSLNVSLKEHNHLARLSFSFFSSTSI